MKKHIRTLLIVCIFLIFSFFYWKEFFSHQKKQIEIWHSIEFVTNKWENFSLSELQTLENVEVISTPSKNFLHSLVQDIKNAKKEIFIEVYLFTEKRTRQALIEAKKRGVNVQIILEKNPYKASKINDESFQALKNAGIGITWSNNKNYSLNHSKLIIIDEKVFVSTGNLSYSTFAFNKDFFIVIRDEKLKKILKWTFFNDFNGRKEQFYHENLVASPYFSRSKLETLFSWAQKSINMYMPYLDDKKMNSLLENIAKNWVKIAIIIDEKSKNDETVARLKNTWVQIQVLKDKKMHSKVILIDDTIAYIGSTNFSHYSLDSNRELWIIFKDETAVKKVKNIFLQDFGE